MRKLGKIALGGFIAGLIVGLWAPDARAQAAVCGNSGRANGSSWGFICSAIDGLPIASVGFTPVPENIPPEERLDEQTRVSWHIHSGGPCSATGPQCMLRLNGNIPLGPMNPGDYQLQLDFHVGTATMVCRCEGF